MPFLSPQLDQRSAQDIVDELKRMIPRYCPEWTDHNVSDPGVALIELFAWVAELLLYQMNRVPDLHYIKMMELMGMKLAPAQPACAPVTIWLSEQQPGEFSIDKGYEVASSRSESEPSIIFSTADKLSIFPAKLAKVRRTGKSNTSAVAYDSSAWPDERVGIFCDPPSGNDTSAVSVAPAVGDALEFGFSSPIERYVLQFQFQLDDKMGSGPMEQRPETWPYKWQVYTSSPNPDLRWQDCDCEYDETKAFRISGRVQIHLPVDASCGIDEGLYWVRVCIIDGADKRPFADTPCLLAFPEAKAMGGAVWAEHVQVVHDEKLGVSDGTPGQRFVLAEKNLVPYQLTLRVTERDGHESLWREVDSLEESSEEDRVFTVDRINGEIRFGPALRQSDGRLRHYGAVPPSKAELRVVEYYWGGGEAGSVAPGKLDTPKTAISYISRVSNRRAAQPGLDAETVEAAMMRAPTVLRSRDRAVTAQDFESLAQTESRLIAYAKCVAGRQDAGRVVVYVLANRPRNMAPPFPAAALGVADEELARIQAALGDKCMLGTTVTVRNARLLPVAVQLQLAPQKAGVRYDLARVRAVLEDRLYRGLDPWQEASAGRSPFQGRLSRDDVSRWLFGCPEAIWVTDILIRRADPITGEAVVDDAPNARTDMLLTDEDTVLVSGKHEVW